MTSLEDMTEYLEKHFSKKTVEYISGLEYPGQKLNSMDDKSRKEAELRIQQAYDSIRPIIEKYDSRTARAWLFGMNRGLNSEAPAYVIRHAKNLEELSDVVAIAKEFAN